jgi:hypothetical protein
MEVCYNKRGIAIKNIVLEIQQPHQPRKGVTPNPLLAKHPRRELGEGQADQPINHLNQAVH